MKYVFNYLLESCIRNISKKTKTLGEKNQNPAVNKEKWKL